MLGISNVLVVSGLSAHALPNSATLTYYPQLFTTRTFRSETKISLFFQHLLAYRIGWG